MIDVDFSESLTSTDIFLAFRYHCIITVNIIVLRKHGACIQDLHAWLALKSVIGLIRYTYYY